MRWGCNGIRVDLGIESRGRVEWCCSGTQISTYVGIIVATGGRFTMHSPIEAGRLKGRSLKDCRNVYSNEEKKLEN